MGSFASLRNLLKLLVAIILILLLFFNISGYEVFYAFQIAEAKKEMKQQMQKGIWGETVRFSFERQELTQLHWEDGGAEFSLNGRFYDVVAKRWQGNNLVIDCIPDEQETALVTAFMQATRQHTHDAAYNALAKMLLITYLPCSSLPLLLPESFKTHCFSEYQFSISFFEVRIPTPPPDVC